MPYIVIKTSRQETDRRELTRMLVLGRAPECDVTVRDIALSRRHCRIDETSDGWTIVDLGSKNGTSLNGDVLSGTPRPLCDMDVVRLGQSRIVFYAGIPTEDISDRLMSPARPADPHEALAGTVSGFTLLPVGETETYQDMPLPQPEPRQPASLHGEELQQLLMAIASSSWDSIYAEARQPAVMRPMPSAGEDHPRPRVARPRSPIDLSLQASLTSTLAETDPVNNDVWSINENPPAPVAVEIPNPGTQTPRHRWKDSFPRSRAALQRHLGFTAAGVWICALALLGNYWLSPANRATSPALASQQTPKTSRILDQPASPAAMKTVPTTQPQSPTANPIYLDMPPFEQRLPLLLRNKLNSNPLVDATPIA